MVHKFGLHRAAIGNRTGFAAGRSIVAGLVRLLLRHGVGHPHWQVPRRKAFAMPQGELRYAVGEVHVAVLARERLAQLHAEVPFLTGISRAARNRLGDSQGAKLFDGIFDAVRNVRFITDSDSGLVLNLSRCKGVAVHTDLQSHLSALPCIHFSQVPRHRARTWIIAARVARAYEIHTGIKHIRDGDLRFGRLAIIVLRVVLPGDPIGDRIAHIDLRTYIAVLVGNEVTADVCIIDMRLRLFRLRGILDDPCLYFGIVAHLHAGLVADTVVPVGIRRPQIRVVVAPEFLRVLVHTDCQLHCALFIGGTALQHPHHGMGFGEVVHTDFFAVRICKRMGDCRSFAVQRLSIGIESVVIRHRHRFRRIRRSRQILRHRGESIGDGRLGFTCLRPVRFRPLKSRGIAGRCVSVNARLTFRRQGRCLFRLDRYRHGASVEAQRLLCNDSLTAVRRFEGIDRTHRQIFHRQALTGLEGDCLVFSCPCVGSLTFLPAVSICRQFLAHRRFQVQCERELLAGIHAFLALQQDG